MNGTASRLRVPSTKLTAPAPPAWYVPRARLLTLLTPTAQPTVTLVCAPAGAGKTVLLAGWAQEHPDAAWLSLDSDDNDDQRFWSAVCDALTRSPAVPQDNALRGLAVPEDPSLNHDFLARVVNALDEFAEPVVLILDEVHELTDPQALGGLAILLRHRPAGLRLVLAGRRYPQLSLSRLRLTDSLTEIRGEDLRFSLGEARSLLKWAGFELAAEQEQLLLERTEGWAAGLRLATLAMARTGANGWLDVAAYDDTVAAYLSDEVLSQLPGEQSEVLRSICVSADVPGALATRLTDRADATELLDAIGERTQLVTQANGQYHVQAFLRTHVAEDLARHAPVRAARLHRIAATWYADSGKPALALFHAGKAANAEQITALLHRHAAALIMNGDHTVVHDALAALGTKRVARDSMLSTASALLQLEWGDLTHADRDLAYADHAWPDEPAPDLIALRKFAQSRKTQVRGDRGALAQAVEQLTSGAGIPTAAAMVKRGEALLAVDDFAGAGQQLRAALAAAHAHHLDYVMHQGLSALAVLAAVDGDYYLMTMLATSADEVCTRHGWHTTLEAATTDLVLAYGALLLAGPAECRRWAERSRSIMAAGDPLDIPWLHLAVETLLGAAEVELGRQAAGVRRINAAVAVVGPSARFTPGQVALSALVAHRGALLLGWEVTATRALKWAQASIPESAEVHLMRARAQLAAGRRKVADKIIQPVLRGYVPALLNWTSIEAWLLSAELLIGSGDTGAAGHALTRALRLSTRIGVIQPLVTAAPEVIDLLTSKLGTLGRTNERLAQRVLTRRTDLAIPPMVPLTRREYAVLRLLPTLRSFAEIADDLMVSVNTVKTHVRAIYAKLGASKRRDAVAVASERGLLEYEHSHHGTPAR